MAQANAVKTSYQAFSDYAAAYLHIQDRKHYEQALSLVEELLQEAEDKDNDPLNGLIELLSVAIDHYEDKLEEVKHFENTANQGPADIAMLRLLMEQYDLGVADFSEIGDKSLISRILSGERNLTKQHIQKLVVRFKVDPALFFGVAREPVFQKS